MTDIRQTPSYAKYLIKIGWTVEGEAGSYLFIKKLPILGSIVKLQRPQNINFKKLSEISKKYRAFKIVVEPANPLDKKLLLSLGYKQTNSYFLPTKTLFLDIRESKRYLLGKMKKDAKDAIKKTKRVKIRKYSPGEIENFRNAYKKAVGIKRSVPSLNELVSLKKTFGKNCYFISDFEKNSGAIFLKANNTAYYWRAFSNSFGRENLIQYKIVWRGINWAKTSKATYFDFEGVYDKRFPNPSWLGFSHFKRSFGGEEITYPGCFVKNRLPLS